MLSLNWQKKQDFDTGKSCFVLKVPFLCWSVSVPFLRISDKRFAVMLKEVTRAPRVACITFIQYVVFVCWFSSSVQWTLDLPCENLSRVNCCYIHFKRCIVVAYTLLATFVLLQPCSFSHKVILHPPSSPEILYCMLYMCICCDPLHTVVSLSLPSVACLLDVNDVKLTFFPVLPRKFLLL